MQYRIVKQAVSYNRPRRTRVTVAQIKHHVNHAKNLCANYENTPECRIAWEVVNELTEEYDRQYQEDLIALKTPDSE